MRLTVAQTQRIVHDVTEAMVGIGGENLHSVTWVVIDEVKGGDWGIGSQGLHASDVLAMAQGAPA